MSVVTAPGWIVDRLRANLGEQGIALAERDLDRMVEQGMLRTAIAFEPLDRELAGDGLPDFLADGGDGGAADTAPDAAQPAPAPEGSIAALAERIRAREVSPVELTEQALRRIAERDPELNAFQLVLRDQALAAARAAEREIAAGRHRGPLHGVPVAVKDLLDLKGTPTTAGSKLRETAVSDADATAVARLRSAGAVIVGKTRLAEFAYSPGSNNSTYGPTRNPHDPSRDAGGSSSGSGAAVASGLAWAALGSDTGGSIRIPASLCGIVGLKPTFGRVSLSGAVPLAWSMDHLGPMTRCVADAALLLELLAGPDPADPRARAVAVPVYTATLGAGVRGLRVGVLGDDGEDDPLASPETLAAWRAGLAALADAGASLQPLDLPMLADVRVVNGALIAMEAAVWHRPLLRARAADYGEFARLRLLSAHAFAPGQYLRAQIARARFRREIDDACHGLDLVSTPTMPGPAPPLGIPASTRHTAPFNLLGWPAISVPVGSVGGLPLGLQLAGKPWQETTVLRAARVVERSRA